VSYLSAIRQGEDVIVWERDENGRTERTFRAPYNFYVEDPEGKDSSIYGTPLTNIKFRNSKEFREARDDMISSGYTIYESDIPPELKVLSSEYYGKPAPPIHITFLDIEVDYDKLVGFSTIDNPYAPINAIAFYHEWQDKIVVFALPPKKGKWIDENGADFDQSKFIKDLHDIAPIDSEIEVLFFDTERELLLHILAEIEDSDILCGWNSDFFDMPYIAKRIEKVLGAKYFRKLCFPGADKPKYRDVEMYGTTSQTLDLSGRVSLDYLALFKKYEMDGRPSYKLEAIADEVVPELPKLKYEGTLADLYKNDFLTFIRYNIRDTEILKGFEQKLGYVGLANVMVHISAGLFKHALGTLKLAELATVNYCNHELNLRVNNNEIGDAGSIQGAFVLIPQTGMHDRIGSVDITSLYPSAIRSINISPETLIGQFRETTKASEEIAKGSFVKLILDFDSGEMIEKTADEWRNYLKEAKCAVSGYGTVFDQTKPGIIPSILKDWFNTRKKYQKLKGEAKAAGDKDKAAYYDRLQYVYKIKLNSLYGALNNSYFRFYDLRMGESTTGTGRMILAHQCAKACELLDGTYMLPNVQKYKLTTNGSYVDLDTKKPHNGELHHGYSKEWSVIYGDTDSTYFETHGETDDEAVLIADMVGEKINESFPEFMRETFLCGEGFDDIIKTGREIVASRGIFVEKKRYILRVIDNEGDKVDKLKVMGLDTKKTTLPAVVSKRLNDFVGRLLKGETWEDIAKDVVDYKDELEDGSTRDIMTIGLPKGVQRVEHYTQELKVNGAGVRLPGHVAASIHYNICREKYGDNESMPIISGMKIKVFYITEKVGRFKSIAIPTDAEKVPDWFFEHYKIDMNAHITRLIDNPLNNIVRAIGKETPTRQSIAIDDFLEF